MASRVVVTGCGVYCALGGNTAAVAQELKAGRSGVQVLDESFFGGCAQRESTVAARAPIEALNRFARYELEFLDRVSQQALIAATEAIEQSGWVRDSSLTAGAGVFLGTGMGGAASVERAYADMFGRGSEPRPFCVLSAMNNAAAGHLSMRFGLKGPNLTVSSACASSAIAIGEAFHAIRRGRIDGALAGGSEACVVPGVVRAWRALRVLAQTRSDNPAASCRPFSADRSGIVLGEGAAVLALETADSAERRGAPILCELLGYGASADARHITNPNFEGQARAMSAALVDACLEPCEIDYINAHGTATPVGDLCETHAIKRVFGDGARRIPISSTKSVHGHLLGGAGALEFAACVLAMRGGFVPATMHLGEPDPECDLDYVANAPRDGMFIRRFMSNSFAFGGSNAVLIGGSLGR
jgi:3-oxoacyl-[acyl-carrier-protein] synthase II